MELQNNIAAFIIQSDCDKDGMLSVDEFIEFAATLIKVSKQDLQVPRVEALRLGTNKFPHQLFVLPPKAALRRVVSSGTWFRNLTFFDPVGKAGGAVQRWMQRPTWQLTLPLLLHALSRSASSFFRRLERAESCPKARLARLCLSYQTASTC